MWQTNKKTTLESKQVMLKTLNNVLDVYIQSAGSPSF